MHGRLVSQRAATAVRNRYVTSAMENPYRSPIGIQADSLLKSKLHVWRRFAVLLLAMVALNFARLLLTWHAFNGDGYEQIEFPFVAYEQGGFSYSETIYYQWIAANLGLAVPIAYIGAHFLRDGWYAAFRKLQTWGNEDVT